MSSFGWDLVRPKAELIRKSNVFKCNKKVKLKSTNICAVIFYQIMQKKPTLEKLNLCCNLCFQFHLQASPIFSAHMYLGTLLHCTLLKQYKDMKYWAHSSSWRLWFTCKAPANSQAPMFEILFLLRLQNVREEEMRGGSTNTFILRKVYLVSVPHYLNTVSDNVCQFVS